MRETFGLMVFLVSIYIPHTEGWRLNDHIRHFEPLSLSASSIASTQHKLTAKFYFNAHGRVFDLRLKTYSSLFHPDFHLLVVGKEGIQKKRVDTKHIVTGNIKGERGSLVYGRVVNDSFDGTIRSKGETYHIDPLSHHPLLRQHSQVMAAHNRVIYRASDVEYDKVFRKCSSGNSSRLAFVQKSGMHTAYDHADTLSNILRKKRQSDEADTCTIKIVADYPFFTNVGGGSEKNTLDEMTQHIMNADQIYKETEFGNVQGSRLLVHSSVIFTESSNPLEGQFSESELLEAFSEENFDAVCLGHLFTYRDFQGTVGLAYLGDPNGQLAGGICQKRTRTAIGEVNLNTGFTSLLNFGRRLSRAISFITVAHEIGHNYGSEHDPAGECFDGKYIMYPYATDGNRVEFSSCSRTSIGRTIEVRGSCFTQYPSGAECGNGIIEDGEQCDCGETQDQTACYMNDPCCLVNCTLKPGANCSTKASTCCGEDCQPLNDLEFKCLKGDSDLSDGGCQRDTFCELNNPDCPTPTLEEDGKVCNNGSNVCEKGACVGSPCLTFDGQPEPCYCENEADLCHVCCKFDGKCSSTFEHGRGIYVAPNYPCKNFTGYCTEEYVCKTVNNDDILNNLRDILLNFTSILNWIKGNWYWVLGGFGGVIILIILLQVTYRRKKLSTDGETQPVVRRNLRWGFNKRRPRVSRSQERDEAAEGTGLITRQTRT